MDPTVEYQITCPRCGFVGGPPQPPPATAVPNDDLAQQGRLLPATFEHNAERHKFNRPPTDLHPQAQIPQNPLPPCFQSFFSAETPALPPLNDDQRVPPPAPQCPCDDHQPADIPHQPGHQPIDQQPGPPAPRRPGYQSDHTMHYRASTRAVTTSVPPVQPMPMLYEEPDHQDLNQIPPQEHEQIIQVDVTIRILRRAPFDDGRRHNLLIVEDMTNHLVCQLTGSPQVTPDVFIVPNREPLEQQQRRQPPIFQVPAQARYQGNGSQMPQVGRQQPPGTYSPAPYNRFTSHAGQAPPTRHYGAPHPWVGEQAGVQTGTRNRHGNNGSSQGQGVKREHSPSSSDSEQKDRMKY